MLPFSRPEYQKIITSSILWAVFASIGGFVVALITTASSVGASSSESVRGPLGLFQIEKVPQAGGGFQASIAILPGFYLLLGCTVVAALALSAIRLRSRRED